MFAFLRSRSAPPAVIDAPLLDTLADAHAAAEAEADAAFTPERAAAQRAAILARLGAAADQRVLSFPPRAAEPAPRAATRAPRPALGWMLTAAAAGLIVGVGTGQGISVEWPRAREPVAQRSRRPPSPCTSPRRPRRTRPTTRFSATWKSRSRGAASTSSSRSTR